RTANQRGRGEKQKQGTHKPDRPDRKAADQQRREEQPARADAIGQISHRQLRRHRGERADRQREAEVDKTDTEMLLQVRKQRRQYQSMEMGDEMRRRDQPDRLDLAAPREPTGSDRISCHSLNLLRRQTPLTTSPPPPPPQP